MRYPRIPGFGSPGMERGRARLGRGMCAVVVVVSAFTVVPAGRAVALSNTVLILGPTVTGGASSLEAQAAVALGLTVEIADAKAWAAKTTAAFGNYRAIVIGDPNCGGASAWAAAQANAATWGPATTGNTIVIGTDPVFHSGRPGAVTLINKAMAFATADATKTGAYMDLSCSGSSGGVPVPVLAPFGAFTTVATRCDDLVHITATHPALTGLTDASLSNWSCSTHEGFESFPADFAALAMAVNPLGKYTAPDGTVGMPYILARGSGLSTSSISLTPATASVVAPATHTLTATVLVGGSPVAGTMVTFAAGSGPNAELTGTGVTDAAGQATFTYTSASAGTDMWAATWVSPSGVKTSNTAEVVWTGTAPTTAAPTTAAPTTAAPTTAAPTTSTTTTTTTTTTLALIFAPIAVPTTTIAPTTIAPTTAAPTTAAPTTVAPTVPPTTAPIAVLAASVPPAAPVNVLGVQVAQVEPAFTGPTSISNSAGFAGLMTLLAGCALLGGLRISRIRKAGPKQ